MTHRNKWNCLLVEDSNSSPAEGSIRVICFSDTHSKHNEIPKDWFKPADIALFAGDFTKVGSYSDTISFKEFYKSLPYKHKVLIAGNHEVTYDVDNRKDIIYHYFDHCRSDYSDLLKEYKKFKGNTPCNSFFKKYSDMALNFIKKQITNDTDLIYLEESSVTINGLNIFGTPYSPYFYNWSFPTFPDNEKEKGGLSASRMNKIPENTDIVIAHGPPLNIFDLTVSKLPTGDPYLAEKVKQIEPALCLFGHIHEAYGYEKIGNTMYANVSTLNFNYQIQNKPLLFDLIPNSNHE